mmetsp:Transcript_38097/g.122480  ORF Transcript_38097/g.122480 Transcript_38097/m.122480 type:complete len:412 (+) Transcript_38097:1-1236(+)
MASGGMAGGHMHVGSGMASGGMASGGMASGGMAGGHMHVGDGMVGANMPMSGGGAVGGVGGGAGACGCAEAAGCGSSTSVGGVMSFVGTGGAFTMETTYKYVGMGAGQFDLTGPAPPSRMPLFACGGVAVLALVAVLLVLCVPTASTTLVSTTNGVPKDCLLWGDPHIETFDGGFPNAYGEGEFWIVKSNMVSIQGRYLATPFTNGLAATHQIAVGGKFMGGHKFTVGPMENGQITCDDGPILQGFPSEATCGPVTLNYNGMGKLVDDAQSKLEKHIVHFDMPSMKLHIQILRWANHLNVKITMPPQATGMDGSCGNFNGNAIDDSTEAITARMGGRVAMGELLFRHAVSTSGVVVKTIADCMQTVRQHAIYLCQKNMQVGAQQVLMDSCIFDVCFGGDQYAGENGLAQLQ